MMSLFIHVVDLASCMPPFARRQRPEIFRFLRIYYAIDGYTQPSCLKHYATYCIKQFAKLALTIEFTSILDEGISFNIKNIAQY
jgi:hypothetical protein